MDKITHKVRCEQWANIIKECLASGMNKTAWCREHGISDKSFFYWQRRLREEAYISTFRPDVIIRKDACSLEISNTASAELLSRIGGLLHAE